MITPRSQSAVPPLRNGEGVRGRGQTERGSGGEDKRRGGQGERTNEEGAPGAKPCFHAHPRNLTPDNETGLGRFTERQVFNALRHGLRPEDTPDVGITSTTPGAGNFPLHPRYLAVPMPWMAWRHMPDEDLWSIAAYLKRGVRPVHNLVPESEGPPDFWASAYTVDRIGSYPASAFPTKNEQAP